MEKGVPSGYINAFLILAKACADECNVELKDLQVIVMDDPEPGMILKRPERKDSPVPAGQKRGKTRPKKEATA